MDELGGFEPTDTTGFIQIESIRIKKYVICSYEKKLSSHTDFLSSVQDGHKPTSVTAKLAWLPRMSMGVVPKICRDDYLLSYVDLFS
jgi:hypothetical protein